MNFGFEVYVNEDRLGLRFWNWFWKLGLVSYNFNRDPWHSWGICYSERALHLRWGKHTKIFWMPWDYGANIRNEVQNEKGDFVMASDAREGIARRALIKAGVNPQEVFSLNIPDGRKIYKERYTYLLKNGELQERIATFHVEEREWRWRIFHPFAIGPKKVSRCIWISFDQEVGERTGSWKGGCTGCGYEMIAGETPVETLRRMEYQRKFE